MALKRVVVQQLPIVTVVCNVTFANIIVNLFKT
jgi:hypothetical protein